MEGAHADEEGMPTDPGAAAPVCKHTGKKPTPTAQDSEEESDEDLRNPWLVGGVTAGIAAGVVIDCLFILKPKLL